MTEMRVHRWFCRICWRYGKVSARPAQALEVARIEHMVMITTAFGKEFPAGYCSGDIRIWRRTRRKVNDREKEETGPAAQ